MMEKLKRIGRYFLPHWPKIFLSLICTIVIGATSGISAWLVKPVLDDVFIKNDQTMLWLLPVGLMILYVFRGTARYGQGVLMTLVGERVILKLRDDLMRHIQSRELGFFDKTPTGELITKLMSDVAVMQSSIPVIIQILRDGISAIGLIIVLFTRNFELAIIAFAVFPFAVIPIKKIGRKLKKFARRSMEESGGISKILVETFTGIEVIKAFNWEKEAQKRFHNQGETLMGLTLKRVRLNGLIGPSMEMLAAFGAAAIIWYGGHQVITGQTTPGSFFSFMTALFMAYDPLKKIGGQDSVLQMAFASAERVFEVMDSPPAPCEASGTKALEPPIDAIEFKNVRFSYETRDEEVLKGVSFSAKRGDVVALVGDSGGGKSTVLKLLPRFYAPTQGQILLNGVDLMDYDVKTLRSNIAIVNQNTFLFDDTIMNNILLGRPDATQEEVMQAARSANAHKFISELPNGYDTIVGERGDLLSGGQKQRISIARAILKNSPILILDEATSALDSESEREIQEALKILMQGKTTFIIAHRLSTIMHADQIVFIKGGQVTERGRHDALYAKDGDYARLCKIQFNVAV